MALILTPLLAHGKVFLKSPTFKALATINSTLHKNVGEKRIRREVPTKERKRMGQVENIG